MVDSRVRLGVSGFGFRVSGFGLSGVGMGRNTMASFPKEIVLEAMAMEVTRERQEQQGGREGGGGKKALPKPKFCVNAIYPKPQTLNPKQGVHFELSADGNTVSGAAIDHSIFNHSHYFLLLQRLQVTAIR